MLATAQEASDGEETPAVARGQEFQRSVWERARGARGRVSQPFVRPSSVYVCEGFVAQGSAQQQKHRTARKESEQKNGVGGIVETG